MTKKEPSYTPETLVKGGLPANVTTDYLRRLVTKGLERRYASASEERCNLATSRVSEELQTIEGANASAFFLLTWECRRIATKLEMPTTPGWGITAESVVCYALGISDLDPLAFGLSSSYSLDRMTLPGREHRYLSLPICADARRDIQGALIQHFKHIQFAAVFESETSEAQCGNKVANDCMECRHAGEVPQVFVPMRDLSIQRNILQFLRKAGQNVPPLSDISLADKQTYAMIAQGGKSGMPFFDRSGIRTILDEMAPRNIETLTVAVARYLANINQRYSILKTLFEAEPEDPVSQWSVIDMRRLNKRNAEAVAHFHEQCVVLGRAEQTDDTSTPILSLLQASIDQLRPKTIETAFSMPQALVQAVIAYRTAYLKAHFPDVFAAEIKRLAAETEEEVPF